MAIRAIGAAALGAVLIVIGLAALRAPDPGSKVGVVPLLSAGGALCMTALGAAGVAVGRQVMRLRRRQKLPRAVVVRSRCSGS
jgi:hypothetical protein